MGVRDWEVDALRRAGTKQQRVQHELEVSVMEAKPQCWAAARRRARLRLRAGVAGVRGWRGATREGVGDAKDSAEDAYFSKGSEA